jgi:hypothetical protein
LTEFRQNSAAIMADDIGFQYIYLKSPYTYGKERSVKNLYIFSALLFFSPLHAQTLQLHYDCRHSIDPHLYNKNFPMLYFELFKQQDIGSFLIKMQSDLDGKQYNIGKFYMQASQSIKFWKPKIYLSIQYSGGLGIAEPGQYGFYINNAFSAGTACPFQCCGAWFNVFVSYTYNVFKIPSHDLLCSFYWGKGFLNYKIEFIGDFVLYSLNKNHGDALTLNQHGKRIAFYAEPQLWINMNKCFSLGTKLTVYDPVLIDSQVLQIFPTIALRYKL